MEDLQMEDVLTVESYTIQMWVKLHRDFHCEEDENVSIFAVGKNLLNKSLSLVVTPDKRLCVMCRRKTGRNLYCIA